MESTVLVKAFGLLEATAGVAEGRALAELAAEVGLTKPTTHRILKTLVALGYVERCRAGVYRQTGRLRQLVTGRDDRLLLALADPILRELYNSTHETVNLGVLRHGRILYLHVMESTRALRRVASHETVDPIYCTALGRAIVSQLPIEQRKFHLRDAKREKRTPHTVIDMDELLLILDRAKQDGYAIERDQTDVGVTCIGAPVFDNRGVVAAISLSAPSVRLTDGEEPKLIDAVRRAAGKLTDQLQKQQSGENGNGKTGRSENEAGRHERVSVQRGGL